MEKGRRKKEEEAGEQKREEAERTSSPQWKREKEASGNYRNAGSESNAAFPLPSTLPSLRPSNRSVAGPSPVPVPLQCIMDNWHRREVVPQAPAIPYPLQLARKALIMDDTPR